MSVGITLGRVISIFVFIPTVIFYSSMDCCKLTEMIYSIGVVSKRGDTFYMKKCCFIGHREIEITKDLENRLDELIERLINNNDVNEFLFGSRSEFNSFCYDVVCRKQRKYPNIKRVAYLCKHEEVCLVGEGDKISKIYQKITETKKSFAEYEEKKEFLKLMKAGRASYVERNNLLIDDSDFVVLYLDTNKIRYKSGTYLAYEYALKSKKNIINVKE